MTLHEFNLPEFPALKWQRCVIHGFIILLKCTVKSSLACYSHSFYKASPAYCFFFFFFHPCNYLPCCRGILWLPSCQSLFFSFWLLYFNSSCWRYFRMGKCHTLKILPNSHILVRRCIDPCPYANTYTHTAQINDLCQNLCNWISISITFYYTSSDIFEQHSK